jgi:hypothetical protein
MMFWYALLLFPASISEMQLQEWKAFQPYRDCVLNRAKKLARSSDAVPVLEGAAKSKCRRHYDLLQADIALDQAGIAVDTHEPTSPFFGFDPHAYFRVMETTLSNEFADVVANRRSNLK